MTADILAERTFTLDDQHAFARLTGDANPIHVDPVAARRSLAGAPLVHGVHLLLWGLDALCRRLEPSAGLHSLRVNFEKMVPVGARVQAALVDRKADRLRLEIRLDGRVAAVIVAGLSAPASLSPSFRHARMFDPVQPLALSLADMAGLAGHVALRKEAADLRAHFPALALRLDKKRIAGLAAATFLVGMVCPGLHSIFRSLDLVIADGADNDENALHFSVSSLDERFRMARIAVSGGGWTGRVDAHVRPEPVAQPGISDIAMRIDAHAFEGVRALIVGGSRGLGETLAKVLASGAAEVAITYRIGREDADRVAGEIRDAGGICHVLAYDVTASDSESLQVAGFSPNQIYYMATPPIRPGSGIYSASRLAEYMAFYVDGFARAVEATASGSEKPAIFYPSTVFIEDAPTGFAEYAMAKAAGEVLCREFVARGVVSQALVERLPRLLTDQTRTLADESFPDAVGVLVGIAAKMSAGAAR